MENKTGICTDDQGNPSSMRYMSWVSLFAGIAFGLITLLYKTPPADGFMVTLLFVVGAFAPKAIQKFAELKVK